MAEQLLQLHIPEIIGTGVMYVLTEKYIRRYKRPDGYHWRQMLGDIPIFLLLSGGISLTMYWIIHEILNALM